jgi:hypothetical protein
MSHLLFRNSLEFLLNGISKELQDEVKFKKVKKIISNINITSILFQHIKPYFYTLMAILLIIFGMNCFQFYYFIKTFSLIKATSKKS